MVAGTYGDFSSQNIVNDNNLKDPVRILRGIASESFKAEQQFYLQIGMPKKFCESAEQTTELLKSSGTFEEYQKELCLRVFGASHEEYKFLKYFYDSNFIKALSAQTPGSDLLKSLSTDLLKYYRAIGVAENENNINDIDFDFEDFVKYLESKIVDNQLRISIKKINQNQIKTYLISYIAQKTNEKNEAKDLVINGIYKDMPKKIVEYIKSSTNPQDNRGYSVLKLAQIQFIDDAHTFEDQFNDFVKNVINFIGNQLNTAEVPPDLENNIRDQLMNGVAFAIATKNTDIEVNGKVYKSKGSGRGYKQLTSQNSSKEVLQLTYSQIIELSKNKPFFLKDIKLQGDNKVISTIFTDKIKNQIRELNDGYDINFELDNDELTISNDRLYMDRNMFFNNMMKLKFDYSKYASKDYAKNNGNFQTDKEMMSNIFYDTLKGTLQNNLVVKDNQADVISSFNKWWAEKGEKGFLKMLDNNPTQIYEIASKSAEANVAGMLGETLMGLFLSNIQIPDSVVKVLGQSDHGNGQAAVDLKIMFPDNEGSIKTAGFQIKQYAASESSGNKVDLYSDTSLKLSDTHMARYLEATYLEKIRAIFFKKDYESYWLNSTEGSENGGIENSSIEETKNILNAHLMYFMRYDEAQMKNGTFDELEQNNFYIINFRFIPASSLFILAAFAIEDQLGTEMTSTKDFFFFSETVKHVGKQNNMMSSLIRYINLPEVQEASKSDNLCEYMIDDFRLNFVGFSVNFKQQLDSVLKNTK